MESSNLKNKTLLVSTLILTGLIVLTGCTRQELFIPEYYHLNPPPEEVTITQLLSDYLDNEITADAKYKGKRLLFNEVEVELVDGLWVYIGLGEWIFEKAFFYSGSVKFFLYGDDYDIMQNIEEGYVLNIVGECQGLFYKAYDKKPYVIVDNCWVDNVSGNLRNKTWQPPMY